MEYTKKEKERYNARREKICQSLGITKNNYNWLRRKGEALHKIYEWQCNGVDNTGKSNEKLWERWEENHYKKITDYTKKLGLNVYYQTDPRGATIYIDNKPIPENNYTQAYCIY